MVTASRQIGHTHDHDAGARGSLKAAAVVACAAGAFFLTKASLNEFESARFLRTQEAHQRSYIIETAPKPLLGMMLQGDIGASFDAKATSIGIGDYRQTLLRSASEDLHETGFMKRSAYFLGSVWGFCAASFAILGTTLLFSKKSDSKGETQHTG